MIKPIISTVSALGASALGILREIGGVGFMLRDTFHWAVIRPFKGEFPDRKNLARQFIVEGINSIPIVALLSFTVGLILAMQGAHNLKSFGASTYFPALVSVATVRELGPLIAAIIISGRVGASIAAELGTMVVAEEIDALRSMSLHPIKFLIVPRVVALAVMLPCLAMLANISAIAGAYIFGVSSFQMSFSTFKMISFQYMVTKDVTTGIFKSFFFSFLISGISCYKGMAVSGGAEGVGKATTESVVHSIFAIIIADGIFTAIFYFIFP